MKKRFLSAALCLCMVLTLLPAAALAVEFNDTQDSWAEDSIQRWTDEGIIEGDGTGAFNPTDGLDRGSAAKIVSALMKYSEEADTEQYTDMDPNAWYQPWIAKAVKSGVMNGVGGNLMNPTGDVTREMMFVMVARAVGIKGDEKSDKEFTDGDDTSDWAAPYINALANMGVLTGKNDGTLSPIEDIDRASTMGLLDKLIGGYANEDGDTVEIEEGKITLIVADNVKVEGNATNVPIVVAGDCENVDMAGVEGEAVVNVQTSDVTIKNAPAGTEIVAAEDATGVTANGIDVSGDADKDVVIPEQKPTPTPGPSGPSTPTDSVTEADITKVINDAVNAINEKIGVYAKLSEVGADNVVTVSMYDTSKTVGDIKADILTELINKLNGASSDASKIAVKKSIDGTEPGTTFNIPLTEANLTDFVKAIVGDTFNLDTTIAGLNGKEFTVTVTDTDSGNAQGNFYYTVKFVTANKDLDNAIETKVTEIDGDMDYASLSYAGNTLSVSISNGTTKLDTVFGDIGQALCNAFNTVRDKLQTVKDGVSGGTQTLDIADEITTKDLLDFLKGLDLQKGSETESLAKVLGITPGEGQSSSAEISKLYGWSFVIDVTPKNGSAIPYTITFAAQ